MPSAIRPTLTGSRYLLNIVALIVLVAVFAVLNDAFLTTTNVINVLRQISVVVTVGCFFTLLMVSGCIDLSIGGVLGLCGMVCALLVNAGVPLVAAIGLAVALGAGIGVINGFMVAILGINTVIATLGTLYVTSGATLVLGEGMSVRPSDPAFPIIGNGDIGPIPILVVIMLITLIGTLFLERRTSLGRAAVLVGANAVGARLSGLPVRTTRMVLFVATAATAAFAGVMVASRHNAALPAAGTGFEFEVIIATLLGGTSLLGGAGSVIGLLLGALLVGTLTTGLNIVGVPSFIQTVLLGVVLLAAVSFDVVVRNGMLDMVRPGRVLARRGQG